MKPFEESFRYDYPLTADDLVINVGGFRGDVAAAFHERYGCRVIVFEPVKSHYDAIVARFAGNPKIEVYHAAIGGRRETATIYVAGDSSGRHVRDGVPTEETVVWNAADMIRWTKCPEIQLLELNCESGEYSIIASLLAQNLLPRIRHLQVQWHLLEPYHEQLYSDMRKSLQETHDETWGAGHVWENWSRRP